MHRRFLSANYYAKKAPEKNGDKLKKAAGRVYTTQEIITFIASSLESISDESWAVRRFLKQEALAGTLKISAKALREELEKTYRRLMESYSRKVEVYRTTLEKTQAVLKLIDSVAGVGKRNIYTRLTKERNGGSYLEQYLKENYRSYSSNIKKELSEHLRELVEDPLKYLGNHHISEFRKVVKLILWAQNKGLLANYASPVLLRITEKDRVKLVTSYGEMKKYAAELERELRELTKTMAEVSAIYARYTRIIDRILERYSR